MGMARIFLELWERGLSEFDDLEDIAWEWQSIDGSMVKATLAKESVGPNPADRGKNGTKRHILVEEYGIPLSIVVIGTNRHDVDQPLLPGNCSLHLKGYKLSFNALLGVNFTAVEAGIWISLPVCGLRPLRAARFTVLKLPKPEMAMASPFFKEPAMMLNNLS
jgi:hypothetical protein